MERSKIAEYRLSSMAELEEFLKVAESCGYIWNSGTRPTRYNPVDDNDMDVEEESMNLWSDSTLTYGETSVTAETFTGELPMIVYGTERPKRMRSKYDIIKDLDNAREQVYSIAKDADKAKERVAELELELNAHNMWKNTLEGGITDGIN